MPEASYYSYDENNNYMEEDGVFICNDKNMNNDYVLMSKNKQNSVIIPTNRFQIMSRLAQYHLVDGLSRSIDYKLKWHDKNKELIFGIKDNSYDDYYTDNNIEMSYNNIVNIEEEKNKKKIWKEKNIVIIIFLLSVLFLNSLLTPLLISLFTLLFLFVNSIFDCIFF